MSLCRESRLPHRATSKLLRHRMLSTNPWCYRTWPWQQNIRYNIHSPPSVHPLAAGSVADIAPNPHHQSTSRIVPRRHSCEHRQCRCKTTTIVECVRYSIPPHPLVVQWERPEWSMVSVPESAECTVGHQNPHLRATNTRPPPYSLSLHQCFCRMTRFAVSFLRSIHWDYTLESLLAAGSVAGKWCSLRHLRH